MTGYCFNAKCKTKREIKDAQNVTMKNGTAAVKGTCTVCGGKIFAIVKKS